MYKCLNNVYLINFRFVKVPLFGLLPKLEVLKYVQAFKRQIQGQFFLLFRSRPPSLLY